VAQVGWVTLLLAGTTVEVFLFGRAGGPSGQVQIQKVKQHAICILQTDTAFRPPAKS
jgi:hypothetical protein